MLVSDLDLLYLCTLGVGLILPLATSELCPTLLMGHNASSPFLVKICCYFTASSQGSGVNRMLSWHPLSISFTSLDTLASEGSIYLKSIQWAVCCSFQVSGLQRSLFNDCLLQTCVRIYFPAAWHWAEMQVEEVGLL